MHGPLNSRDQDPRGTVACISSSLPGQWHAIGTQYRFPEFTDHFRFEPSDKKFTHIDKPLEKV